MLSQADWNNYFATNLHIHTNGAITIKTAKADIPFPTNWKYISGGKYLLYSFGNSDYLFMPGNNGVGTYMLYIDHNNKKKDYLVMNYIADSITCQQLPKGVILFRLTNSEFVQNADTLILNRYLFIDTNGKISSKAALTHGCVLKYNSIDTLHNSFYFDVAYTNNLTCNKCFNFNYSQLIIPLSMNTYSGTRGTIVVEGVHYVTVTGIEGK